MSDAQAQFEEMLIALTSGNTELIRQAEEAYNDAVKSDPVWVIQALTEVGVNSANASASNIALVQLRKLLSRNLTAFDACPIEVQTHVKTSLINFFGSTTEKLLRRAAAGCISNLAVKLSSDGNNAWPELWELLMNALGDENADPEIRAACCLIFGQTAAWLAAAYLRAHMQNIMTTLQSCVAFGHSQLAVEAAHALRGLIDNADKKDIPAITHSPIIPSLIESAGNYILNGDAETAESIIADLCDIAEDNVEVLKPHANTIFNAMSSIAQNAELEKDLRHHAIDLVLTYGESDPKTFRKAKQFTTAFFELMVQYVTRPEMEDNWSNTYEDSTTTNGSDFEAGASAMDRMCVVLRGKQVQDMATNHIMANINSDQWEMRAAALTVLTYVAEGCHKQFMRYLDMIVDELILPRMTDEHPMVRYCACQAIAQLSTDFKPMWQEGYAAKLLPPLCEILNDPVPRLRAMAAATIDQFFDDLDEDDEDEYDEEEWANRVSDYKSMQPFMNHILQALFAALTNAEYDFQRKTLLTCFATVLQVAGKIAAPFVQDLVPLFQGLLAAPDSSESEDAFRLSRQIKCGAIECTTLLASNVGNEHFGVYGHQVCQYLMSLLQEGLSNDDMRLRYILRGWTCMVECLGAEVLPYLEVVMPQLLNVANLECDAVVTEAEAGDEDDHANDNSESKVQIVRVMDKDGAKNVKLHTSLIEDKDLAITIIMVILQEIKGGAAPWVSQITDTCIKLLEFLAFPDIRDTAAETLAALSVCVKEADPDNATNFVQYIITPLLSAMESEPELHVARQMVETLGIVVDNAPHGSLYDEPVHNAAKILEEIFSESLRRLEKFLIEHDKKKAHESEEEEEAQTLEALAKGEDFMLTEVAETVGKLVKTTPAFIEHYEREFLPLVTRLIDPTKPSTYHRLGICLLCDYVEYAPQSASVHLSTIAEAMVQFMQSSDPEVIQASMFGAGITAELVAQVVPQPNDQSSEFAQAVCDTAMRYLLTPDSREAENFSVSANAVSCILRVIQAFSHAVNMHAAMQAVVQHLPVQDDKTEEIRINDMLVQWAMDPANPALQDATLRRQVIFAVKRSKYMSDAARDALASL